MKQQHKRKMSERLGYFKESGTDKKQYALILAAYYDQTNKALEIIESEPEQINRQDPHSGLTALHIAIFRQNKELVEYLTAHPETDTQLKDNFNRRAVDMLDYTSNQDIFGAVMDATYPELMAELEEFAESDDELPEIEVNENKNKKVVPFKPNRN